MSRRCAAAGRVPTLKLPRRASVAYTFEPFAGEALRAGRLKRVLESYSPTVPGFFLYFPRTAQRLTSLRLFIDAAKELATRDVR